MTVVRNPVKTPSNPVSSSVGATVLGVIVESVDPTSTPPIAIAIDSAKRRIPVRIDMQRGKGSIPRAGERWIIDQAMGFWSFACFSNGDPDGNSSAGGVGAVEGLPQALDEHATALDNTESRLDEMWSQGTVTATPTATSADVTLLDGTVIPGCQTVSAYAPAVGDTVWTARADAAGARVVLGPAASAATNLQAANLTITDYGITSPRLSNWWLKLIADRRIAQTPGFPVQGISMFHTDGSGARLPGIQLDFVQGGSAANPTMLMKNDVHDVGILFGDNALYITNGDNTGRSQVWATAFGASDGGGIGMGADRYGNPAIVMNAKNLALVGGADGVYVTNAANTARADLRAYNVWAQAGLRCETGMSTGGVLVVDGQTTFNGGVIGNQGAAFSGLPLRSASFGNGGWNPALNQIVTTDITVKNNIAVDGTFYYRGAAQPVAASERDLKEHIENLGDPWGFIEALVPARYRWWDTEYFDDRPHVGLYVNEMYDADPDTVIRMPQMPREMAGLDDDGNPLIDEVIRYNSNIGRSYEDRAVLAYLARAAQDLHSRVRELEAVIADRSPTKE